MPPEPTKAAAPAALNNPTREQFAQTKADLAETARKAELKAAAENALSAASTDAARRKKHDANLPTYARLMEAAHKASLDAQKAAAAAVRMEAHARDFEGACISASAVNETDPERAARMFAKAEEAFKKGPQ